MSDRICPFISGIDADGNFVQINCQTTNCFVYDNINGRCGTHTSDIQIHVHNQHRHPKAHLCGTFGNDCGIPFYGAITMTLTSVLLQEFFTNQDLNGDGQIFGYTFQITNDEDIPIVLKNLIDLDEWKFPETEYNWKDYINNNIFLGL